MQFSKASKKTRKIADENASPIADNSTAEVNKPRISKSSPMKKETSETGSAKHRKSSTPVETAAQPVVTAPLAATAAASGSAEFAPVNALRETPASIDATAHEEIAKLAHSYWIERGYAHGYAEEDWLRAEREFNSRN